MTHCYKLVNDFGNCFGPYLNKLKLFKKVFLHLLSNIIVKLISVIFFEVQPLTVKFILETLWNYIFDFNGRVKFSCTFWDLLIVAKEENCWRFCLAVFYGETRFVVHFFFVYFKLSQFLYIRFNLLGNLTW